MLIGALYLGAPSPVHAQSGDGLVAGTIVDRLDVLYPDEQDVIVTTACLEGNPFVPEDPPAGLVATLSGCRLDIPVGSISLGADNNQLITVLPNNFADGTSLTTVRTYGSGSNQALESDVTVNAVSKDVFLGLANPGLFADPPVAVTPSDVATTADVFCTSVASDFDCVQVEPCSTCSSVASCGQITVQSNQTDFCADLTGLLEPSYNLVTNPLAYAIATNMTALAQPGSVTLNLCPGFQAQCRPPAASPEVLANVRLTTMHTQAALVETPRIYYSRYP